MLSLPVKEEPKDQKKDKNKANGKALEAVGLEYLLETDEAKAVRDANKGQLALVNIVSWHRVNIVTEVSEQIYY